MEDAMAIGVQDDTGATDRRADKPLAERVVEGVIKALERLLLMVVVVMTLAASATEIQAVIATNTVDLGDILLMFLYAEVLAMVAVFYTGRGLPIVFPIFIAITALARLIVLQGKDMDPANILIEAAAILLLAIAAVILLRFVRRAS
jgi:protein PsiE